MKKPVYMFGRDGITIVRRSMELEKISDYVYCMRKGRNAECSIVIESEGDFYAVIQVSEEEVSSEMTLDWFISEMISRAMDGQCFHKILMKLLKSLSSLLYNMAVKSNRIYDERMTEFHLSEIT